MFRFQSRTVPRTHTSSQSGITPGTMSAGEKSAGKFKLDAVLGVKFRSPFSRWEKVRMRGNWKTCAPSPCPLASRLPNSVDGSVLRRSGRGGFDYFTFSFPSVFIGNLKTGSPTQAFGDDEGFIGPRTSPCWFNEKPAGDDKKKSAPSPCSLASRPPNIVGVLRRSGRGGFDYFTFSVTAVPTLVE